MARVENILQVLAFVVLLCQFSTHGLIPTRKVQEIIEYEEKLLTGLANYIQEENESDKDIDETITSFYSKTQEENLSFELSPVDVFKLFRRTVEGWDTVLEDVICEDCSRNNGTDDIERALYKCKKRTMWPSESDVIDSAMALVRLGRVYDLDIGQVIGGNIRDTTGVSLSLDDVIFIADVASDYLFYDEAIKWLTAGIEKSEEESETPDDIVIKLHRELAGAYYQKKKPSKAVDLLRKVSKQFPDNKAIKRELQYYQDRLKEVGDEESVEFNSRMFGKALSACEELCRSPPEVTSRRLRFCRLRKTQTPFRFVKEEILRWRPRVVLVHEVLVTDEIQLFENISAEMVERNGRMMWPGEKLGRYKRQNPGNDSIRKSMMRTITDILGLESDKFLHAKNLGLGENLKVKTFPNSLETYNPYTYSTNFLFYPMVHWIYFMTDFVGGDIVFPDLNLRVSATGGNAVYWYNLKPNGEREKRTRYCSCPVLTGLPWVASMQIRPSVNSVTCPLEESAAYH